MKHLFFDLDRTLWDFEKNSEVALHQLYHELGINDHIPKFSVFHACYKKKNAELWKSYGKGKITKEQLRTARFQATLEIFGVHNVELAEKLSSGYIELSPKQTNLFPGAIETLQKLKDSGYSMHIITNGFKEVQYIKLEKSGLASFFDIVICSEEIGKNKPSPDIFHYALKQAQAKANESVMIGDDPEIDVFGALGAGMQAILFDPYDDHKRIRDVAKVSSLSMIPEILPFIYNR